jgi:mRNA-degrading endonuclease RelE of RelBE toxin-antitoxin system
LKVIATPRYEKDAKRLLKAEEKTAMELAIISDPQAHPVVPGLHGVRKARWSRQGKGKSGGVRTIYHYSVTPAEMYLIFIYAKNEQANLNPDQRKQVKKFVEVIKHGKKENQ